MINEQIVLKEDNTLLLTAPVMIPHRPDCDYQRGELPFNESQILAFKESYDDYGFIDKHHTIRGPTNASKDELMGKALKSFILKEETTYNWFDGTTHTYPKGTWMLTSEITDPVAIKQCQDGLITGYSPSVFTKNQADEIRNALKASSGGLIRDIPNPTVTLVSLVRKPCQDANKFCKITNNDGENMSEDNAQSTIDKIKELLGSEPKPVYATKSDMDSALASFKEELMASVSDVIDSKLKEALAEPSIKEDEVSEVEESEETDVSVKADEETKEEDESESEDEEAEEDEKPATKSDSKSMPQHDTGNEPAMKSDTAIVFEMMGRTVDGRPSRK